MSVRLWWAEKTGASLELEKGALILSNGTAARIVGAEAFASAPADAAGACAAFLAGAGGFDEGRVAFIERHYRWPKGYLLALRAGSKLVFLSQPFNPDYWYKIEPTLLLGVSAASEQDAAAVLAAMAKAAPKDNLYVKTHGAYVHEFFHTAEGVAVGAAFVGDELMTHAGYPIFISDGRPVATAPLAHTWSRVRRPDAEKVWLGWMFEQLSAGHPLSAVECKDSLKTEAETPLTEWLFLRPLDHWTRLPAMLEKIGLPAGTFRVSLAPPADPAAVDALGARLGHPLAPDVSAPWGQAASLEWSLAGREFRLLSPASAADRLEQGRAALAKALGKKVPEEVEIERSVVIAVDEKEAPVAFLAWISDSKEWRAYLVEGKKARDFPIDRDLSAPLLEALKGVAGKVSTVTLGGALKLRL
jgi:hypothetical protein